jgi:hypothetical protein
MAELRQLAKAAFGPSASAALRQLVESLVRYGIRPPTNFEGLPPGQLLPIDEMLDARFGRNGPDRASGVRIEGGPSAGMPVRSRGDGGAS